MVRNTHERIIKAPLQTVGNLIDRLGSRDDSLWPRDLWPPVRFDRPLAVGAVGGHGPIRYTVEAYEPGRLVRFRFLAPRGFLGTHELVVEETNEQQVRLRHTLSMQTKGAACLTWPFVFRPLHDALIEDALDCAESFCTSHALKRREWSPHVRLLRCLMIFLKSKNESRNRRQPARAKKDRATNSRATPHADLLNIKRL